MDNTINSLVSQTINSGGTNANQSPWVALYQNTLGRNPTDAELNRWGNSSTITPQQMDKFLGEARNEAVKTMPTTGAVGNIAKQILAQGNTAQWTGQGYGSPEKTAYDMAVMLAGQGIKDINQLGQITKTIPAHEEYFGDGEQGGYGIVPERQVTVYGNKETGQEISPYYDKAGQVGADIWGGTFAGEGSTAYGVSFDASGKPTLYSKYGGSSSNVSDYAPLLLAGAVLGAPYLAELAGLGGAGAGTLAGGEALAGGAGTLTGAGAGTSTLGTLGALGTEGTVAGMGAGTGLTAAGTGAAGLGGAMSALGGEAALGSGLTSAGVGGLGAAGTGAGIGAGSGLAATNAALGGAALGSTLAGASTLPVGSTLANLGAGGSLLGAGAGSALGTSLATGLGLNALGNVLGSVANQSGISNARDLINQYGTKAADVLGTTYKDQLAAAAANRADLAANYGNLNTNLNNTLNAQAGLYGATNTALGNIYGNTLGNLGTLYNQQVGYQQPYQNVGINASNQLVANTPYFTRQFTNADLNENLAPNYAFQLQQGQMANQRAGNISGGALGGNALQGLQRYTQDYAGGAYQNAFNNFQNQRQNIYNTLSGMAGIGQTSTGQLANLGNTLAGNMSSLSSNYGGNVLSNANQLQGAYNQYGGNLTNASNTYGGNLTTGTGQVINAGNAYGLNASNLYSNLASALGSNAVASGANTANTLNNLGNTALLSSMIKTP
jgi:hypothetical protein